MTCTGCKYAVEHALNDIHGISATVSLENNEVIVSSDEEISLKTLQDAMVRKGGHYKIVNSGTAQLYQQSQKEKKSPSPEDQGVFYCPMQCEGEKKYGRWGSCPVCGMDLVGELTPSANDEKTTENDHLGMLRQKFWIAVLFTVPIFLIAMSEMLPTKPLQNVLSNKTWIIIQFFLSLPVVFYACWMFFERAYISFRTRNFNMFTLIGIGAGAAWLFSVVGILFPGLFPVQFKMSDGSVHVYFEAATVILTLVLLGQLLEARAHNQTRSSIRTLLNLAPQNAIRVADGVEQEIAVAEIEKGDLLRIKPGGRIPVDGRVVEGGSNVDESMITGEPIPIVKSEGDWVTSGTLNTNGSFIFQAKKVGSETMLASIIKMVNDASRSRAPIQKMADKVAGYFVPVVVFISILTFIFWTFLGPNPALLFGFINAIAVLIIACPCALGLATPMSIMVGVGKGALSGVLIKNAETLEKMNDVDTLIIDKTGTITEGKPSLEKITCISGYSEEEIITFMAAVNQYSEHPLANAIMSFVEDKGINIPEVAHFKPVFGKGVIGKVQNRVVALGNAALMKDLDISLSKSIQQQMQSYHAEGKTVSILSLDRNPVGFAVIGDAVKEASKGAIEELKKNGMHVIMMTGDNHLAAKSVAEVVGVNYKAELLPADKLFEIEALQKKGKTVAMAGDGINDAPALAKADVGIAMGTGTDVAIESAGITLVRGNLEGIVKTLKLSRKVMKNIRQNLFFALIYNAVGVPIAAGVLYPFFGVLLSPMVAALAMSFSSVSVIGNALRLRNVEI